MLIRSRTYKAGESLTREAEFHTEFYVLESGTAEVFVDGDKVAEIVATDSKNEFIGEVGALLGVASGATVIAKTACTVLPVPIDQLKLLIMKSPQLGVDLAQSLARKLNAANITHAERPARAS